MKTKFIINEEKVYTGFGILKPGTYLMNCSKKQIEYLEKLPEENGYIIKNLKNGGKK